MLKRLIGMLALVVALAACGDQGSPPGSLVTPPGGAPSQPTEPSGSPSGGEGDASPAAS